MLRLLPSGVQAMFRATRSEFYRWLLAANRRPIRSPRRRWPRLVVERVEERIAPAAVLTDKPDYFPGDTALLSAVGFDPGATGQFQVVHDAATPGLPHG